MSRRPLTYRSIWILYYRYRDTNGFSIGLIGIVVLISFLLLWKIIVPQLNQWFSIRAEVIATRERITIVQENIAFVATLNDSLLDADLRTVITAYPLEKDFAGILQSISRAASLASVALNDYTLAVGALSTDQSTSQPIEVTLTLNEDVDHVKAFIRRIQQNAPLVEVMQVEIAEDVTTLSLQFPYASLPKLSYKDTQPIDRISPKEASLIQTLASWQK